MSMNSLCCSFVRDLNRNESHLNHVNMTCGVKGHYKSRDGMITIEAKKEKKRGGEKQSVQVYFNHARKTQQHHAVI